jgi:hypothetical protein
MNRIYEESSLVNNPVFVKNLKLQFKQFEISFRRAARLFFGLYIGYTSGNVFFIVEPNITFYDSNNLVDDLTNLHYGY